VTIEKVEIRRVVGGAAKWMPASAKLPPLPGLAPPGRAVQIPISQPAAPAAATPAPATPTPATQKTQSSPQK
jgi:hypothetical protein